MAVSAPQLELRVHTEDQPRDRKQPISRIKHKSSPAARMPQQYRSKSATFNWTTRKWALELGHSDFAGRDMWFNLSQWIRHTSTTARHGTSARASAWRTPRRLATRSSPR